MKPINIKSKFQQIKEHWHPHRIARVDNMQVLLAKIKGEFIWHSHEKEDELFMVVKGTLHMQFRDRTEIVSPGEFIVVPKGIEHCPATTEGEEVHILLFEKENTAHTGNVTDKRTRTHYPEI